MVFEQLCKKYTFLLADFLNEKRQNPIIAGASLDWTTRRNTDGVNIQGIFSLIYDLGVEIQSFTSVALYFDLIEF